jgi:hypothetical protein
MAQSTDMPNLHALVRDRIQGAIAVKEALPMPSIWRPSLRAGA